MSGKEVPKTMLAWQKHFGSTKPRNGQIRVEVPVPVPPEDGLLIKIHAAGVCHSDFALLNMEVKPSHYLDKYTLGHEGCGEVVSVGPKVTKSKPGDMVSILSVPGCGSSTCRECSGGVPQICAAGEHYGIGNDGSFAPYIAVRERAAVHLPMGISAAAGAVATDACLTAYQAVVSRAKVKHGDTVLLYGLGGLGFNALQIILDIGARVIVVDKRQEVLDEAVKFGVKSEDVVPVGTASVSEWVAQRGLVVDTAIDFVGVPETFRTAIESVRMAGTVVLVGLLQAELTLPSMIAVRKRLDILCSYGGTVEDLVACLVLIGQGVIKPQVVTGSMADFPSVLEDLHAGKIQSRIALVPEDML
ncbi:uncharacterized protein A1O5_12200 [Cladophialophora psammophila CBS 110553]|uniref:Enoyl reductase (ER) domain-containing protein n=1 Tax=Cladophialophora psammophila CBS 110553 TaxID=1182543 RepID=W9WLH1_9EURO|nr:uncharacterized protein A1O5_12200 [Cladophialophora psammophila CBS 110553]EXJ59319.1 hypothetical protein A1O5_12200 [Cladophialophora psammophila CBS 110553]